jgi:hypothetical protein
MFLEVPYIYRKYNMFLEVPLIYIVHYGLNQLPALRVLIFQTLIAFVWHAAHKTSLFC